MAGDEVVLDGKIVKYRGSGETTGVSVAEEFHAERATGIGGSDAAAIVGLSRYGSPYTVWARLVGLLLERTPPGLGFLESLLEVLATGTLLLDLGVSTGEIAAQSLSEEDEVICVNADLDLAADLKRTVFNYAAHRRPEHYKLIVERMTLAANAVVKELGRTFYAFKTWEKAPLSKLYISGGTSRIKNFSKYLQDQLEIPVEVNRIDQTYLKINPALAKARITRA